MIRPVLQKGGAILLASSAQVVDFDAIRVIYQDLCDTIEYLITTHDFTRGIGLAAPQLGVSSRISVARYADSEYVLINPEIKEHSVEKRPIREGCISFFTQRGNVPRYTYVKVKAQNLDGLWYELEVRDDFSMLLQHEIDHLNGILYTEHLPNGDGDLYLA